MNSSAEGLSVSLSWAYLVAFLVWVFYPVFVYTPVYLGALGYTGSQIGVIASVLYIAGLLFSGPAGVVTDKFSVRAITSAGFVVFCFFPVLLLGAVSPLLLVTAYVLGALGSTLARMGADAFFLKSVPEGNRFRAFGYFTGVGGLGMALGYVTMGYIVGRVSFHSLYGGLTLFSILAAGLTLWCMPSVHVQVGKPSYRQHIRSRAFLLLACAMFLHTMHFGAEVSALGLFLMKEVGLSGGQMGLAMGLAMLSLGAGGIAGGRVGEQLKKGRSLYILGLMLSGTGNIFMALSQGFSGILCFRLLHELGDAFIFVAMRVMASRIFPSQEVGGVWGAFRTVITAASFIGAILYGAVAQAGGYRLPFLIAGGISVIAPFFLIRMEE